MKPAKLIEKTKRDKPDQPDQDDDPIPFLQSHQTATKEQYAERVRVFNQIDQKAQMTAGMAGIFLAALFSYLRKDQLQQLHDATGKTGMLLITLAGAALVTTFLLCLFSLRVRNVFDPTENNRITNLLHDTHQLPVQEKANRQVHAALLRDLSAASFLSMAAIMQVTDRKAKILWAAQLMLTLAVILVAALLIIVVYRGI